MAASAAGAHCDVDDGQRGRKRGRRRRRLHHRKRGVGCDALHASRDEGRIGEKIEGGQAEFRAPAPGGKGDIGADAGRLTQRQRQRQCHPARAYLYSSIAPRRSSCKYALDRSS